MTILLRRVKPNHNVTEGWWFNALTCSAKYAIMHIQMTLIGSSSVSVCLGEGIVGRRTAALKIGVFQNPLA